MIIVCEQLLFSSSLYRDKLIIKLTGSHRCKRTKENGVGLGGWGGGGGVGRNSLSRICGLSYLNKQDWRP